MKRASGDKILIISGRHRSARLDFHQYRPSGGSFRLFGVGNDKTSVGGRTSWYLVESCAVLSLTINISIRRRSDVRRLKREKRKNATVFLPRQSMNKCKLMHIGIRLNASDSGHEIGRSLMQPKFLSLLMTYLLNPLTVRLS